MYIQCGALCAIFLGPSSFQFSHSVLRVKVSRKGLISCIRNEGRKREIRNMSVRQRKRKDDGWTIEVGGRIEIASKLIRSELRFI